PVGTIPPTNTPTNTVTPTRTATPTVNPVLVVHVTWQGIGQPDTRNSTQTITMTLRLTSSYDYQGFTTDANGNVTFPVGTLASGTYNMRVKGPRNLDNCDTVALTGAPVTNKEMGTLKAGDADNSNNVNATDFSIMKNSFGKGYGQTGYDPRADFDNN